MTSKLSSRPPDSAEPSLRELQVAREIGEAFLTARRPNEVYRLALERVAPLVGASFGCVFLQEPGTDLLRIVAAYNWPQAYAGYLSSMRVRVGNGPTGRAVADQAPIEVLDVFADESLEDWWDSARELGFASSASLPLIVQERAVGAVTFYFREPETLAEVDRSLLRLVADQLAATAEKAHLIENLQEANQRLVEQNIDLESRYREAEEARRLKNEFLAVISHELRTPLTSILGWAYLLRDGIPGSLGPEQLAALQKIDDAGNSLVGLINDLLDLTHLKLGRTLVEPQLTDAASLLRACLDGAPDPAEGVTLTVDAPDEKILVHTDPIHVLRILRNLLSNALKFTSEGSIRLSVRSEQPASDETDRGTSRIGGPDIVWEFADTGIGIEEDDQQRIFDEFRQVDGSATRRFSGAGLGLAVSQALAGRLGGEITVRSTPGTGSTFSLTIPAGVVSAGALSSPPNSSRT